MMCDPALLFLGSGMGTTKSKMGSECSLPFANTEWQQGPSYGFISAPTQLPKELVSLSLTYTASAGPFIYVIDGIPYSRNSDGGAIEIDRYDVSSDRWTSGPQMMIKISALIIGTVIGGKLYTISSSDEIATCQLFDPESRHWQPTPSISQPAVCCMLCRV
jgi:hypothetical protein